MRFLAEGRAFTREETMEFLLWAEGYQRDNGFCRWKTIEKVTGETIGSCGFARPHGTTEIELGYVIRRDRWGIGLATEAARACMHYGFDNLGFREIIAMTDPQHLKSRRVLENIGFHERGSEIYKESEILVYLATSNPENDI